MTAQAHRLVEKLTKFVTLKWRTIFLVARSASDVAIHAATARVAASNFGQRPTLDPSQ